MISIEEGCATQLREMGERLIALADFIEHEKSKPSPKPQGDHRRGALLANEANAALRACKNIYDARRLRRKYLNVNVFGEPAWDILLDLYRAKAQDQSVSITSACIAADVPTTTGLRWLSVLEEHGLVERKDDERDNRVTFVNITPLAESAMSNILLRYIKPSQNNNNEEFLISQEVMK